MFLVEYKKIHYAEFSKVKADIFIINTGSGGVDDNKKGSIFDELPTIRLSEHSKTNNYKINFNLLNEPKKDSKAFLF